MISLVGLFMISCSKKDEATPQEETKVKYKNAVSNVIYNNCITCHSGNSPSANLDLSSYSKVKEATQNGNLLHRINDANAPMPPIGLMTEENRKVLNDWKSQGYLE